MEARNLPKIDEPLAVDEDSEQLTEFAEAAITLMESHLESNRSLLPDDDRDSVDKVVSRENIDHLQIRSRPFENPRVTLWLKDCPTWANDAWRETFHPFGLNDYNGKVTATFDVRPF
jgi:hypothetical protein